MVKGILRRRVASNVQGTRESLPARALTISVGALALAVLGAVAGSRGDPQLLLWLIGLAPAFLLAYHWGWRGAAVALSVGVGVLALTEALLARRGEPIHNLPLLAGVVVAFIAIALAVGALAELFHSERDRAERLALTDELTGMANRRYARVVLDQEFAAARRGRPLALVMLDIDQFKAYNDVNGHGAGDEALRVFAAVLQRTTRQMNLSARYGGEEFVSILSDTDTDGALIFLERVRKSLADASIPSGGITFSAGVAAFVPGMCDPDELVAAADAALYRAKAAGRDRAEVFGDAEGATAR